MEYCTFKQRTAVWVMMRVMKTQNRARGPIVVMGDEEADGKAQVERECDVVMERRRMKEGEIREQVDSWWHSGKRRWESVKEWRSGKWWMWQRTSRKWYKCSHFHACNNSNIAVHNVNCALLCCHLHQCQTSKCPSPTRRCEFKVKDDDFFFFCLHFKMSRLQLCTTTITSFPLTKETTSPYSEELITSISASVSLGRVLLSPAIIMFLWGLCAPSLQAHWLGVELWGCRFGRLQQRQIIHYFILAMLLGLCTCHHFQCLHKNKNKVSQMKQKTAGEIELSNIPREGSEEVIIHSLEAPDCPLTFAEMLINRLRVLLLPHLCPIFGQKPPQTV